MTDQMKLKIGLRFKTFFNENNINNRPFNEVRAIVDNSIIVLLSETKKGEPYYQMIDIFQFKMYVKEGVYIPL